MFNFLKKKEKSDVLSTPQQSGIVTKLADGLVRTRNVFAGGIIGLFSGKKKLDRELIEELEIKLLTADVGVAVTGQIIEQLKRKLKLEGSVDAEVAIKVLQDQLEDILSPCEKKLAIAEDKKPFVILFVGINGSGKTTTIGKLACKLKNEGHKVMLAAGDTFRAAAIEQLKIWGERNDVPVIAQKQGSDSSAVLYDALQAACARKVDILIADTAGRLHTQDHLMEELKKIKRTLQKIDATAPHEIILVLDAGIGQNALNQAKQFRDAIGISGICITKLDGTAKGGIIFAVAQSTKIPIRFIGVGERIEDLKPFCAKEFVAALFES